MFVYEARCYDLHGNSIDYFTQWDTNQKIVIELEGCGDDYHIENDELQTDPEVHFTNIKRDTALAVKGIADGNKISVDVPNIILEEPYPVLIYVYYTSSKYPSSQSTIARTEIAVRQKAQPHNYYYVENITTVTAEMIKDEVFDDVASDLEELSKDMENNVYVKVAEDITDTKNKMNEIDKSFTELSTTLSDDILTLENIIIPLKDKADSESKVFEVEGETMKVKNIDVEGNIVVGKWIWFDNEDQSLSLKWVGGDE